MIIVIKIIIKVIKIIILVLIIIIILVTIIIIGNSHIVQIPVAGLAYWLP